jgi:PAS domain-containing protein
VECCRGATPGRSGAQPKRAVDDRCSVRIGADWTIAWANDRYCDLVKMPRDLLIGREFWEVFPFLEDAPAGQAMRHAMTTRRTGALAFPSFYRGNQYAVMTAVPDATGGLHVLLRYVARASKPALRAARSVLVVALPLLG